MHPMPEAHAVEKKKAALHELIKFARGGMAHGAKHAMGKDGEEQGHELHADERPAAKDGEMGEHTPAPLDDLLHKHEENNPSSDGVVVGHEPFGNEGADHVEDSEEPGVEAVPEDEKDDFQGHEEAEDAATSTIGHGLDKLKHLAAAMKAKHGKK